MRGEFRTSRLHLWTLRSLHYAELKQVFSTASSSFHNIIYIPAKKFRKKDWLQQKKRR